MEEILQGPLDLAVLEILWYSKEKEYSNYVTCHMATEAICRTHASSKTFEIGLNISFTIEQVRMLKNSCTLLPASWLNFYLKFYQY